VFNDDDDDDDDDDYDDYIQASSSATAPQPHHHPVTGSANYSVLISWPWKLIVGIPTNPAVDANEAILLDGHWTISPYYRIPPPSTNYQGDYLLFNLEIDEVENHNVASLHPDIVASLSNRVEVYWSNTLFGFIPPKLNIPMLEGNPALWNWTWSPYMP
jgi:hypothetical protein